MPGISRLFEVRPRALWISAPPPPSRYAVSSRRVCLVLSPKIAAAEISVRRLAKTSEKTSMRCNSRPLIATKPNLCLDGGQLRERDGHVSALPPDQHEHVGGACVLQHQARASR